MGNNGDLLGSNSGFQVKKWFLDDKDDFLGGFQLVKVVF
jgi:hypothetical protein